MPACLIHCLRDYCACFFRNLSLHPSLYLENNPPNAQLRTRVSSTTSTSYSQQSTRANICSSTMAKPRPTHECGYVAPNVRNLSRVVSSVQRSGLNSGPKLHISWSKFMAMLHPMGTVPCSPKLIGQAVFRRTKKNTPGG